MNPTSIVLLAFLPPLLLWIWVRRKIRDDVDPDPFLGYFMAGTVLLLPVAAVEYWLSIRIGSIEHPIWTAVIKGLIAGFVEETSRALVLAWLIYRRRGFAKPRWIIAVSLALAMGAVAAETLVMVATQYDVVKFLEIVLVRAVVAVPVMASMGLAVGVLAASPYSCGERWVPGLLTGLGLAIMVHAGYDSGLYIMVPFVDPAYFSYASVLMAGLAVVLAFLPVRGRLRLLLRPAPI